MEIEFMEMDETELKKLLDEADVIGNKLLDIYQDASVVAALLAHVRVMGLLFEEYPKERIIAAAISKIGSERELCDCPKCLLRRKETGAKKGDKIPSENNVHQMRKECDA